MTEYLGRSIESDLRFIFDDYDAILLTGPRGTGKTTTARRLVDHVADLSNPEIAQDFNDDPFGALDHYKTPLLIDEWQLVPDVLWAVKQRLDSGSGTGRYIVAGSFFVATKWDQWPLTGRTIEIKMLPFTEAEIRGIATVPLVDRMINRVNLALGCHPQVKCEYLHQALLGGFPDSFDRKDVTRIRWIRSYLQGVFARRGVFSSGEEPVTQESIRRYFQAYAAYSGLVCNHSDIYRLARMHKGTAENVAELLNRMMLTDDISGWQQNRTSRLVKMPKRFLIDSGLLGGMEGLSVEGLNHYPELAGRLLETYVAAQLRAQATWAENEYQLHHVRTQGGDHELDLLLETRRGGLIGVEIKSNANPSKPDVRHLVWLRKRYQRRWIGGVILHTGPDTYDIDGIVAAPIATLWAEPSS